MHAAAGINAVEDLLPIVIRMPHKGKNMHPGSLGHRIRRVACHIANLHSPALAGLDIDIVDAGSGLAYQFQFGGGVKEFIVHDNLVDDGNVAVGRTLAGFFCRGRFIAYKLSQSGNLCHRGVAHGKGIKEYYLHYNTGITFSISWLREPFTSTTAPLTGLLLR